MFSKRELEGYVMIDHRMGDGITLEQAAQAGKDTIAVPAGKLFESATTTCSHCSKLVVLNPDRSRPRGYCPKCDRYICDFCETNRAMTGACTCLQWRLDRFYERVAKPALII